MVVVDTSIWRCALSEESEESFRIRIQLETLLNHYLVAVSDTIRYDVLQLIQSEQRAELLAHLNYLPNLPVKSSTWNIAIQIAWDLSDIGITLLPGDAVGVALALQNQIPLFTLNPAQREVANVRKLKLLE